METEELILRAIEWLKADPIIAIVILVIVALLFYFRPKPMLRLLAILLAFTILFYFVSMLGDATSTGVFQKQKMIQQD